MKTKVSPDISRAEYDILNALWRAGRQSVREVHDTLQATYTWAYSTTKTTMDRMVSKGLLDRENFHGVFLYKPLITKPVGMARWVRFFADRVLEMEIGSVINMFARSKALTEQELEELKQILDQEDDKK